MKSTQLKQEGEASYALVFDIDDEVMAGLTAFAQDHGLRSSRFTGIGAFHHATLAYWSWERKEYAEIAVDEQVEVLALTGNIASDPDGSPKVHAHVVLGRRDGSTLGGHLVEATVRPTLEVMLVDASRPLRRRHDGTTGLDLIDLKAG